METITVNIKDVTDGINAIAPISAPFKVNIDKAPYFEKNKFDLFLNKHLDYEKARFYPLNNEGEIRYILHKNDGTPLFYSDFGFVNEDISFLKNRFVKSALRFNYFDNDNPTSQTLLLQYNLYTQILSDQLDLNSEPLDVTGMPITFISYRPESHQLRADPSLNYHLHFFRSYSFPMQVFSTYSFLNARDGQTYNFISKPNITDINEVFTYTHNNINLYQISNRYFYEYDMTDRDIISDGNKITINLYAVN